MNAYPFNPNLTLTRRLLGFLVYLRLYGPKPTKDIANDLYRPRSRPTPKNRRTATNFLLLKLYRNGLLCRSDRCVGFIVECASSARGSYAQSAGYVWGLTDEGLAIAKKCNPDVLLDESLLGGKALPSETWWTTATTDTSTKRQPAVEYEPERPVERKKRQD